MDLLWVARHGQTADAVKGVINSDSRRQASLDETGRKQAVEMSRELAHEPIEICFASSFTRAVETARIALAGRPVPIHVRHDLNEVQCGDFFEGQVVAEYLTWCRNEGIFAQPPGAGGDRFADTLMRYHDAFRWIAAQPQRTGLVVTHGSPVAFVRRVVDISEGTRLFDFPPAELAVPYRVAVGKLLEGLTWARARILERAMRHEVGRRWARQRGLIDSDVTEVPSL